MNLKNILTIALVFTIAFTFIAPSISALALEDKDSIVLKDIKTTNDSKIKKNNFLNAEYHNIYTENLFVDYIKKLNNSVIEFVDNVIFSEFVEFADSVEFNGDSVVYDVVDFNANVENLDITHNDESVLAIELFGVGYINELHNLTYDNPTYYNDNYMIELEDITYDQNTFTYIAELDLFVDNNFATTVFVEGRAGDIFYGYIEDIVNVSYVDANTVGLVIRHFTSTSKLSLGLLTEFSEDVVFSHNTMFNGDAYFYNNAAFKEATYFENDAYFESEVNFYDDVAFKGEVDFKDEVDFMKEVDFFEFTTFREVMFLGKIDFYNEVDFHDDVNFTGNVLVNELNVQYDLQVDNNATVIFENLSGTGNAYACLTYNGILYRSNTPCN